MGSVAMACHFPGRNLAGRWRQAVVHRCTAKRRLQRRAWRFLEGVGRSKRSRPKNMLVPDESSPGLDLSQRVRGSAVRPAWSIRDLRFTWWGPFAAPRSRGGWPPHRCAAQRSQTSTRRGGRSGLERRVPWPARPLVRKHAIYQIWAGRSFGSASRSSSCVNVFTAFLCTAPARMVMGFLANTLTVPELLQGDAAPVRHSPELPLRVGG